jgi:hypothetical protein
MYNIEVHPDQEGHQPRMSALGEAFII